MKLTDEQIASIMSKDISSKTMLVDASKVDEIIKAHLEDGWRLIKQSNAGEKVKITFQKNK